MTAKQAVEAEREARMKPFAPWFTGEPLIKLPLSAVLLDKQEMTCYVTLKDVAASLSD